MWFTLLANLLNQNNKDAQASQQAGAQRKQQIQQHIQQNRQAADAVKNQTVSGNYGKYDMNNLIGGVFSNKPITTNSAWGQYGI
jgi:hypothetical protein